MAYKEDGNTDNKKDVKIIDKDGRVLCHIGEEYSIQDSDGNYLTIVSNVTGKVSYLSYRDMQLYNSKCSRAKIRRFRR